MSRKKVILSVFLLAALVAAGIVFPAYWKAEKKADAANTPKTLAAGTDMPDPAEKNPAISYEGFDGLAAFFPDSRIDELKSLFPVYVGDTGRTVTTVTFLPEKTAYPDGGTTELYFSLSDGTLLPVTCSTASGAFFFGEEQSEMQAKDAMYQKKTDDTLPSYSSDDISSMAEGGYADTTDDALPEEFQNEGGITQTGTPTPEGTDTLSQGVMP